MKRKISTIVVLLLFIGTMLNAQELTSKKGMPILPAAGDYAIGINASPLLEYAGNMFNKDYYNDAPSFDFTYNNPMVIYGKYMVDAKTAYRLKLQIGYTSSTDKEFVIKDALTIDPDVFVEDQRKVSNMDIVLGAGIEKRRGNGRLQGIYGAEAMIMFSSGKTTYTYGNDWDPAISHNVYEGWNNIYNEYGLITEDKNGSTFGIGVRGFVGVEYFFAPKMSLGGEFGWGPSIYSQGEGELSFDYLDTTVKSKTIKSAGGSSFGINTDNMSGAINLFFYF
jgi:hypothetical protein